MSLDELSDEWREAMQTKYLPAGRDARAAAPVRAAAAHREEERRPDLPRAGAVAATASTSRSSRTAASSAARCSSTSGSATRETGKRIKRLVKSTTDPNFEELRLLYSQSSFSPDGKHARVHGAARGQGRAVSAGRRKRRNDIALRSAARRRHEPVVVARRQAARVQRRQRRDHRPVHRRRRRQELPRS